MTKSNVHANIVTLLRRFYAESPTEIANFLAIETPAKILRTMFSNFRGGGSPRGLRLTDHGLLVMKSYFKGYEIRMPQGYRILPRHLLFLDRVTSFPYYLAAEYLVLFETSLGVRLRLADGNLDTLMEIDHLTTH